MPHLILEWEDSDEDGDIIEWEDPPAYVSIHDARDPGKLAQFAQQEESVAIDAHVAHDANRETLTLVGATLVWDDGSREDLAGKGVLDVYPRRQAREGGDCD